MLASELSRLTTLRTNGQNSEMTSVASTTASPSKDFLPSIVIGGELDHEVEPFSDHLSRRLEQTEPETRARPEAEERDREPEAKSEETRETDDRRVRDGGRDDAAGKADVAEAGHDTKAQANRSEATDGEGTERADMQEKEHVVAGEEASEDGKVAANGPEAQPSAVVDAAAKPATPDVTAKVKGAASEQTAVAEAVAGRTDIPGQASSGAVVGENAVKEALPRVRKSTGGAQVSSLAEHLSQSVASKSSVGGQVGALNNFAAVGEKPTQPQSAILGQQAQTSSGGENGQTAGQPQTGLAAAAAAQQTSQQAASQTPLQGSFDGELQQADAKTGSQVSQVDSGKAASKAATTASARPTAAANQASVQVAFELGRAANQGLNRISMQLHPAELGRVDVRIEVAQDGRAIATVVVDRPETLDALQRDARSLERALSDAGLQADSGSLNFSLRQDPDSSESFADGGSGKSDGGQDSMADEQVAGADGSDLPQIVSNRALDISV